MKKLVAIVKEFFTKRNEIAKLKAELAADKVTINLYKERCNELAKEAAALKTDAIQGSEILLNKKADCEFNRKIVGMLMEYDELVNKLLNLRNWRG